MRIRNLAKDPKAQKKMTFWGDCAATENDDGTWTYSPNRSPVSFAGLMDPHTPGTMFIVESAKGDLFRLGTESADFPVVGTVRDRYRVYRIVGTKIVIQYFSTTPWNPVGVAVCDPDAYDLLQNAGLPLVFAASDHPY